MPCNEANEDPSNPLPLYRGCACSTFQRGDRVRIIGDDGPTLVVREVHHETADSVGGIDLGYGGTVVVHMADPSDLYHADL